MIAAQRIGTMLVVGGCAFLLGCTEGGQPTSNMEAQGMILGPGNYTSPTGRYTLFVPRGGSVRYVIRNAQTQESELEYDGGASRVMRWFLFWDKGDDLWHYSSDDGTFILWHREREGTWTATAVIDFHATPLRYNRDLLARMPEPVAERLPEGGKQIWGLAPIRDDHGNFTGMRVVSRAE